MTNENEVRAWKERREKRFQEENKVFIEWTEHKDPRRNNTIYAFTQDLSIGGAKILTDINFPINTTYMITLILARSKQTIKVAATVKWVNPVYDGDLFEVGLELIHDFPKTISALIRHLFGKEYPRDVELELSEAPRITA